MFGKIRQFLLIGLLMLQVNVIFAQVDDTTRFEGVITLDSFVLSAVRNGFNVDDFVRFVEEDTTFHQAFRNLRQVPYNSSATVRMFID
ncbi:MAG TPA: hypothetical protein PLB46_17800, partial [Chitinophagales bacterium]|nr:hypothetical protein [Chitinophagales bacterium]